MGLNRPSGADSSQKKQQTISSFFGAKPPSTPKPLLRTTTPDATKTPSTVENQHEEEAEGDGPIQRLKRSLVDAAHNPNALKRPRSSVGSEENHSPPQSHGPNTPPASKNEEVYAVRPSPRSKATTDIDTDRTSKYMFTHSAPSQPLEEDPLDAEEKARLHRRFMKKLGRPDSIAEIKRRNRWLEDPTGGDADTGAVEDEDVEHDSEVRPATGTKSTALVKGKQKGSKLTPMEKQVIDIKRKHMDAVVVVEVGYKFRFFGEDARIAAKELGIVCIPGKMRFDEHPSEAHMDRFASASIPTHRLHVHVKRLVAAGHKVGVVRQLETAALKAVGDNRNAPFVRKLTNLYTKGTYIDEVDGVENPSAGSSAGATATGHLLCITERNAGGAGTDELVHVGILAVHPGTGDIVYDEFDDGFMRSEIETRLLHIAPCEFLIVGDPSKATEKVLQHLSGSKTNVFGDRARVERVEKPKNAAALASGHINEFYKALTISGDLASETKSKKILEKVQGLSEQVSICLSSMIRHLTEYGLEHVFDLTNNFQAFSARSHMLLNGNTLNSLEIYRNQTDNNEKGSLFWVLDQTQTRFGQRLLRKWVGRPLLDKLKLEARINAVEELKSGRGSAAVSKLTSLLSRTKGDLEKSLIRIYYGKCLRPELLVVLQAIQHVATEYAHVKAPAGAGFSSDLLNEAIANLPKVLDGVLSHLDQINPEAAKSNDKYEFFREEHQTDAITAHKMGISSVEQSLDVHRAEAAEKLRKKTIDYVSVAGIEYLIEVENTSVKSVPASWAKISGTKKVSRFHTPEVVRLIRERDQHKEALAAACDVAFAGLLSNISFQYQMFRDVVHSLATLDCLLSLAEVASRPDYVKPTFTQDTRIEVKGGRHPMIEQLLLDAYVPNDISLSTANGDTRALILTGPNMGGKSSYVRQVALISIMGQIGSYVPAVSASLGMLDAVFTRMGAFDNMMAGESTFMVELSETSDILKQATPRSLVILDELGRGTSTHDGVSIAHAVLEHIVREMKCLLVFITHYQNLSAVAAGFPNNELCNVHMRFTETGAATAADSDGMGDITFLFELGKGVAHRSYGLNVARLANLPQSVTEVAAVKSKDMERDIKRVHLETIVARLGAVLGGTGPGLSGVLEDVVEAIEQL